MTTWGDPVARGKKDEEQGKDRARQADKVGKNLRDAVKDVDPAKAPADQKGVADKPKGGADGQKK
jgi:hypothetical protein